MQLLPSTGDPFLDTEHYPTAAVCYPTILVKWQIPTNIVLIY